MGAGIEAQVHGVLHPRLDLVHPRLDDLGCHIAFPEELGHKIEVQALSYHVSHGLVAALHIIELHGGRHERNLSDVHFLTPRHPLLSPARQVRQKQRAALARAIATDPRILILDDALSAVDTYTEEEILSRLRGVMRQRTSVIVSHRVSTVREADQIVVFDGGRIVERGRHADLIALGGAYAELYRKQLLEEELEGER